jgi:uncharacterized membrane protein
MEPTQDRASEGPRLTGVPTAVPQGRVAPGRRLRRYLLTGLLVLLPGAISALVLWRVFVAIDGLLGRFFEMVLGYRVPGAGFVALILLILGIGAAAHNIVGKRLIHGVEDLVIRIPFVRWIYRTTQEISSAVLEEKSTSFRKVVLVEFPYRGVHSIGFQTSDAPSEVSTVVGKRVFPVFVPTVPNPMSGFVVLYAEDEIVALPMSVNEGFRFVISAGALAGRGLDPSGRE